ncbi:MAG: hypothetical protein ABJN84_14625 [Flavobacteriaceae bacterium]
MEENKEKELDFFLKKNIKEIGLEEPSTNFTTDVFLKIQTLPIENVYVHKPLISKWGWCLIALLITGVSLLLLNTGPFQQNWIPVLKLDFFTKLALFDNLNFISNTMVYGFLALTIFIYVQVFVLKRYFADGVD